MSNLTYITQARKLLTEDYKNKHTNEYNSWLANQQHSWMQPHVIVPFPPFIISSALAPFKPSASATAPTEEAVVAKALELYNQFNPPAAAKETIVNPVIEDPVVEIIRQPITNTSEIYKIFQEPVGEESESLSVTDTVPSDIEHTTNIVPELVQEPAVELIVQEPVVKEIPKPVDAIYKIFQESAPTLAEPASVSTSEPLLPAIEQALNIVPQPAEELAKVKNSGGILPSVLQRIQDMKSKWSSTGENNV